MSFCVSSIDFLIDSFALFRSCLFIRLGDENKKPPQGEGFFKK
jgi:hypothetical protein